MCFSVIISTIHDSNRRFVSSTHTILFLVGFDDLFLLLSQYNIHLVYHTEYSFPFTYTFIILFYRFNCPMDIQPTGYTLLFLANDRVSIFGVTVLYFNINGEIFSFNQAYKNRKYRQNKN